MSRCGFNWDLHVDNLKNSSVQFPLLYIGLTALIEDLDRHDMLNDVSVVVWGEFGRSPRINNQAGRDHWPRSSAVLLAGGGMRTGQVIGSTNRLGETPADRPVHYREVFATLYHKLGIDDRDTTFTDHRGRRFIVGM